MLFLCASIYLGLYYVRPYEWVPGLIGTPLLFFAATISVMALGVGVVTKQYPFFFSGKTEKMMIGFTVSIMLSHISHGYFGGAVHSFNLFLPAFTGFFLVICSVTNRLKIRFIILLLIGLTLFLAYEGCLQFITGFAHGGVEPLYEKSVSPEVGVVLIPRIRWYGVFNDPNDLGLGLVIVVPFLLSMMEARRFLIPLLTLPIITLAIYYTNSRGAVLAVLVSVTTYFVIRYRSVKGSLFGVVLGLLLFLVGPSRMASVSAGEESAHGRIEAWYEAYQMFKSYPLFGVGQGCFTDYHYLTAHNSFVQVMAELGFVGLYFFLGLYYFSYNWLWQNVMKNQSRHFSLEAIRLISASYASLTGLLVAMFFLSRSYVLLPFMLIAFVMAVTRIIDFESQVSILDKTVHHWRNIFICTLILIVFINIIVRLSL